MAPLRVLILDDNAGDADLVREMLSERDAVCHATTLAQAMGLAREQVFDVALVDGHLPDAQGVTAVDALSLPGLFPVILLTGSESEELARQAAKCGAHDALIKGHFDARRLACVIACAVQRHESLIQYRTLLHESPDGVLIVDEVGVVLFANPAARVAFNGDREELVGTCMGVPSGEVTEISLPTGKTMEIRAVQIPWRGSRAFLVLLRDVTERARMHHALTQRQLELEAVALLDPLTGVLNRRGLEGALLPLVRATKRTDAPTTALLIDCDDFKGINEAGGYAAGDAALQLVAQTLQASLRVPTDLIGRIGGDEFLVLLPGTPPARAYVVAEKVRRAIRARPLPATAPGARAEVTVSVGVAAVAPSVCSLKEVIMLAQASLCASKRAGKDRVSMQRPEECAQNEVTGLRDIIARSGRLRVEAQRIVNWVTRATVGYELLSRGPRGSGLESPDAMFSAARRDDVLAAADLACLRSCLLARGSLPRSARAHLNVFPSTVLATPIHTLLELFDVPLGAGLVVELSERELTGDPAQLLPALAELRRAGVLIALDDVGFAPGSLEALVVLEPDIVKIDGAAVRGVADDVAMRRMLSRLLTCLRSLGPVVIAEGVEAEADARVIEGLGVSLLQGFLCGEPEALRAAA